MKKAIAMSMCAASVLAIVGTGCTSIETNRVGNQVQVNMPVVIQPTIETKDQVINGSATVHSILGIFSWGPNAQAIGVNYGVLGANGGNCCVVGANGGGLLVDLLSFTSKSEIVARNAAAYNATTSVKADIILAPQYVLTTEDYFFYKSINCKVKGFPGFVKGVKVIQQETKVPVTK